MFIAYYLKKPADSAFAYFYSVPTSPKEIIFPEVISEISEAFIEIYTQSATAEEKKLDQISGVGYRKSLEFLIKDYLIGLFPEKEEEIKKSYLGTCIKKYIEDERIKDAAKRAAWLGNDETHFVRLWENHDIDDLKTLIKLTVNFIESNALLKKYKGELPE